MPTYVIFGVSDIRDPEAMARYNKGGAAATAKHDFTFLAGPKPTVQLEGEPTFERIVLLEFPDRECAERWYNSEDYRAARALRAGAADIFAVMIEGGRQIP